MIEQGFLCCYCEMALKDDNSHIEHFKPQKEFPELALDYQNLLCSCLRDIKKEEEEKHPIHCGHKKGDYFEQELLISPLNPDCESRFKFLDDGRIEAKDSQDTAAKNTIEKLGLDIENLRDKRKKAIDPFLYLENVDLSELKKFVVTYLKQDENGRFNEFWTTIKYFNRDLFI